MLVIILTIVLCVIIVSTKLKRYHKNEAAYSSALQDTTIHTYDYPTTEVQARNSITVRNNEAYVANIKAKPNEAYYAMNIAMERNDAYGVSEGTLKSTSR